MKNPRFLARIGGALYLVIIAIGLFGEHDPGSQDSRREQKGGFTHSRLP